MNVLLAPACTNLDSHYSHYSLDSMIHLARALKKRGHSVVISIEREYEDQVALLDCTYYFIKKPLATFGRGIFRTRRGSDESDDILDDLYFSGHFNERHILAEHGDVSSIIHKENIDIVFSDYRIGAMLASKISNIPLFSSYTHTAEKYRNRFKNRLPGINNLLSKHGIPRINTLLDIFSWSQKSYIPSHSDLEVSTEVKNVIPCGYMLSKPQKIHKKRNKIIVDLGSRSFSKKEVLEAFVGAFISCQLEVHIVEPRINPKLEPTKYGSVFFHRSLDLYSNMPDSALYINSGGLKEIMLGLYHHIPQINIPCNSFRNYNYAKKLSDSGCSLLYSHERLRIGILRNLFLRVALERDKMLSHIAVFDKKIRSLGGVISIVDDMEQNKMRSA